MQGYERGIPIGAGQVGHPLLFDETALVKYGVQALANRAARNYSY